MKSQVLVTAVGTLLVSLGGSLRAQAPAREISLAVGASEYDASGTGTAPVMALRLGAPLVGRWMLGDFSLSYASLDEQFSAVNTRIGVAEGQLQAQLPAARWRPYVGLGGGWFHYFNNASGRTATSPTLSGSVGMRIALPSSMLLRGELRLRTWESGANSGFHNNAAEFTAGLGYAF
jgi:Outer membrane protein beta-barrel domain